MRVTINLGVAVRLLSGLLIAAITLPAVAEEPLRFLETCPEKIACLDTYLYSRETMPRHEYSEPTKLVPRITHFPAPLHDTMAQFTDYTISLRGRLDGGETQDYRVIFRAYTDGIFCSAFGQGSVPIIGYSPEGHPLAVTSQGEIELEPDTLLDIGCVDCLRVFNTKTRTGIGSFTTPAWSLHLVEIFHENFTVTGQGEVLVQTKLGCIRIATKEQFSLVDPEQCISNMNPVDRAQAAELGLDLDHNHSLYESADKQFIVVLASEICV